MVMTAIDDVETSREIASSCRSMHIPVNAADIPPSCDFYFGSQIRRGPLQILISTNGKSPKLANIIRTRIESQLPDNVADAVSNVGLLRAKLRVRAPGVGGELGKRRMKWMSDLCSSWDLDQLAALDEPLMDRLLDEGWSTMSVPSYSQNTPLPSLFFATLSKETTAYVLPFLAGLCVALSVVLIRKR